jgi:glyoxylase-like metal-dependent hydrolase (beta-lactamase superfamily II)
VLFSGDVLMQGVFPSFDAENGSYANWSRALDEISVLKPEIIVGAHGGVGEKTLISDWKQLLTSVAESAGQLKAEGLSQSQASRSLLDEISEKYPQWRSDARRINAAVQVAYREY